MLGIQRDAGLSLRGACNISHILRHFTGADYMSWLPLAGIKVADFSALMRWFNTVGEASPPGFLPGSPPLVRSEMFQPNAWPPSPVVAGDDTTKPKK